MRGPFERLKYDLRRIWECPQCAQRQRTDGSVTTQFCKCGKGPEKKPVSMKLIGDGARRTVPVIARPRPQPGTDIAVVDVVSTTIVETMSIATLEVPALPETSAADVDPPASLTEQPPEAQS